MSRICGTARLAGLLHDAHEALIGDFPGPAKEAIEHLFPGAWKGFELRIATIIRAKYGLAQAVPTEVRRADLLMRRVEVFHCASAAAQNQYPALGVEPYSGLEIWPGLWDEEQSRLEFLKECKLLGVHG